MIPSGRNEDYAFGRLDDSEYANGGEGREEREIHGCGVRQERRGTRGGISLTETSTRGRNEMPTLGPENVCRPGVGGVFEWASENEITTESASGRK